MLCTVYKYWFKLIHNTGAFLMSSNFMMKLSCTVICRIEVVDLNI